MDCSDVEPLREISQHLAAASELRARTALSPAEVAELVSIEQRKAELRFEAIYRAHAHKVIALASKVAWGSTRAHLDDVVAEAFIRVWQNPSQVADELETAGYRCLLVYLVQRVKWRVRDLGRRGRRMVADVDQQLADETDGGERSAQRIVHFLRSLLFVPPDAGERARETGRAAMETLNWLLTGADHQTIAQALHIGVDAWKQRVSRLLDRILYQGAREALVIARVLDEPPHLQDTDEPVRSDIQATLPQPRKDALLALFRATGVDGLRTLLDLDLLSALEWLATNEEQRLGDILGLHVEKKSSFLKALGDGKSDAAWASLADEPEIRDTLFDLIDEKRTSGVNAMLRAQQLLTLILIEKRLIEDAGGLLGVVGDARVLHEAIFILFDHCEFKSWARWKN